MMSDTVRIRVFEDDYGYTSFVESYVDRDEFQLEVPTELWAQWQAAEAAYQAAHISFCAATGLNPLEGIALQPCTAYDADVTTIVRDDGDEVHLWPTCHRCGWHRESHPEFRLTEARRRR